MTRQGMTILELLIVIAVIGILAATLLPNLLAARKQAQYTAAKVLMQQLATEIMICATTRDFPDEGFPADVARGQAPLGCPNVNWPTNVPFNSTIDYENWDLGNGNRWIGLTFFGEANNRDGIPRSDLGKGFLVHKTANNITYSLGF